MAGVNSAVRRLARTCYVAGEDLPSFRRRFLAALRRTVPVDAAFFAAADPETLLFTFAAADEPLVEAAPLFLANEFGDEADVNRFAVLARARRGVATLDEATRGRRSSSARFREVIAPLALGDELRVALRTGGVTWGFLCLHREGPGGFSPSEVAFVERCAEHAGEAIRRIVSEKLSITEPPSVAQVGVVIVDAEDLAVAITDGASTLLEELDDVVVKVGDPLPLPMRSVVRRLEALERGVSDESPTSRLLSRRGALLEIRAARLRSSGGRGQIAITVGTASADARSGIKLSAYRLTPAQRRVAALVLQGRSTLQIVGELGISEYTVQDHLKSVFAKVGVASRRELVAALLR